MTLVDDFMNLTTWLFLKNYGYVNFTLHLTNLLSGNINFMVGVKVDISSKKSRARKYLQEKSHDLIHDVIYRPHLSRDI